MELQKMIEQENKMEEIRRINEEKMQNQAKREK